MIDLCKLMWCAFAGLFRSRAALEAEILVLRHQLNVWPLRNQALSLLAFAFEAFGQAIGNADTFDALRLRGGFVFGGVECGVGRRQTRCAPQQCLMRFNGCNQQLWSGYLFPTRRLRF